MSDDLVKRLRDVGKNYELARGVHVDIRQAADRIEELESKLAKAVEALKGAAQQHRIIAGMDLMCGSSIAYNAAREAEATLAELKGEQP